MACRVLFSKSAGKSSECNSFTKTGANIEALWQHVNRPVFMVFIDLGLAARKERELAAIVRPAQENLRRECYYAALELFPEWLKCREQLRTAIDMALYMMEGMVLDKLSSDGRLLDFLGHELDVLRSGEDKEE